MPQYVSKQIYQIVQVNALKNVQLYESPCTNKCNVVQINILEYSLQYKNNPLYMFVQFKCIIVHINAKNEILEFATGDRY